MSTPLEKLAFALSLLALGAVAAAPARGDWLVTREGARVETKGPWKVQGKSIVFTLPNGTLSSLRATEVDLDSSALATAKAKEPPVVAAPEKRKPVMVLTERDHPPVALAEDGAPAAKPGEGAEAPPGLSVVTWDQTLQPDNAGVELYGTLQNSGVDLTTGVGVTVEVLDAAGRPLVTNEALVRETGLAPGQSTTFRTSFPGLLHIEGVRFRIQGTPLRQRQPEEEKKPEAPPATS